MKKVETEKHIYKDAIIYKSKNRRISLKIAENGENAEDLLVQINFKRLITITDQKEREWWFDNKSPAQNVLLKNNSKYAILFSEMIISLAGIECIMDFVVSDMDNLIKNFKHEQNSN